MRGVSYTFAVSYTYYIVLLVLKQNYQEGFKSYLFKACYFSDINEYYNHSTLILKCCVAIKTNPVFKKSFIIKIKLKEYFYKGYIDDNNVLGFIFVQCVYFSEYYKKYIINCFQETVFKEM